MVIGHFDRSKSAILRIGDRKGWEPDYNPGKCGVIHFPDQCCATEFAYSQPFAPLVPGYFIVSFSQARQGK